MVQNEILLLYMIFNVLLLDFFFNDLLIFFLFFTISLLVLSRISTGTSRFLNDDLKSYAFGEQKENHQYTTAAEIQLYFDQSLLHFQTCYQPYFLSYFAGLQSCFGLSTIVCYCMLVGPKIFRLCVLSFLHCHFYFLVPDLYFFQCVS